MITNSKNEHNNRGDGILFSVVMLAYNHQEFIEEAITSIYAQDYIDNFELIILDDSSKDNTVSKILKLIEIAPKHILVKFIRHKHNIGSVENFNFGVNIASGKLIVVADGDDISYSYRLSMIYKLYKKEEKSLYISNADVLSNKNIIGKKYNQKFMLDDIHVSDVYSSSTPVFGASYIFEKDLFLRYGSIDPILVTQNNVDQNIFWRASLCKGIQYIETSLIKYRKHEHSKTINKGKVFDIKDNANYHLNKLGNLIYLIEYLSKEDYTNILKNKIKGEFSKICDIAEYISTTNSNVYIKDCDTIVVNGIEIHNRIKNIKELKIHDFIFLLDKFMISPKSKIDFGQKLIAEFQKKRITKNEILFIYNCLKDNKTQPFKYTIFDTIEIIGSIFKWRFRSLKLIITLRWRKR